MNILEKLRAAVQKIVPRKEPLQMPSPSAPISLAVDHVILVHGYSVQLLNNYAAIPQLLASAGVSTNSILLSAFISLDDAVSCDDLAFALEDRMAVLEAKHGVNLRKTAMITHSTGAIVTRRWILNRMKRYPSKDLPSHFISCAGANHGSSLAQLGRSIMAKIFREFEQHTSVGVRVLQDLDYGSAFLRRLNGEWLAEWNRPQSSLSRVFCFSMGGADHSFWKNQLAWQAHETGSDGTVRISAANLNYRWMRVDMAQDGTITARPETMSRPAAHLVIDTPTERYSHTSQRERDVKGLVLSEAAGIINSFTDRRHLNEPVTDDVRGILDGVTSLQDRPFQALIEAMSVDTATAYEAVRLKWAAETAVWTNQKNADSINPQADATIVVTLSDDENTPIHDSLIMLKDDNGNVKTVSLSLEPHQPLYNPASPGTMSFYVNADRWLGIHPHRVSVEVHSGTAYASYAPIDDESISDQTFHVVQTNEFTYIDLRVRRNTERSYMLYSAIDPAITQYGDKPYPPLPKSALFDDTSNS
ncbi:MAG TPA: hypothetical protein VN934_05870 [Candidatus Tumulicola sp.]|nr:hypothetical protein [Candidatus Tumulicola sp.]